MCFGGFVFLKDKKRIISFGEYLVCLNSCYNKKILIMVIPILKMRKLAKSKVGLRSKFVQLKNLCFFCYTRLPTTFSRLM